MKEQEAIHSFKIAINVKFVYSPFYPVYSFGMTLCRKAASFFSKNFFQVKISVIQSTGKMSCCSAAFPASYISIFNNHDIFSLFSETICCSQACYSSSYHKHLAANI